MNTKTKSRSLTRRHFLKSAAATGAVASGFFVNPVRAASPVSPNDKLDIAFVGVGNKGWHNVEQLTSENVVALCDIDANFLNRAAEAFPQAVQYRDYRKMLEGNTTRSMPWSFPLPTTLTHRPRRSPWIWANTCIAKNH